MECISCEAHEVFNRVIINRLTGEEIGVYCEDCEFKDFGEMLEDPSWHQENGCAFCENSGRYKLPKLDCLIENDDGSPRLLEYMHFDYTITLCSNHTEKLLAEDLSLAEIESGEQDSVTKIEA